MDKENTFIGADGLSYCSVCHEVMELKLQTPLLVKFDRYPRPCACHRLQEEKEEKERKDREHAETVSRNKRICFHEMRMQEWTFEHDDGSSPAMNRARAFVEHWDEVRNAKAGLLFWGGIGPGKTYMAACIANALLEKEKRVMMTDFSAITNISVNDAREYISCLVSYDLLIIDDLGAERSTEYAIQNVFDVINRRWESGRPLIVTTNLDMEDIKKEKDIAKTRIYDRLLDMCTPVLVDGDSKRIESANYKKNFYKGIFKQKKGGECI